MESIIDVLSQGRDREAQASKIHGFVVGLVTNNKDPEKLGRIKVKFPWLSDEVESWWARIVYPMAGIERGYWWIPEIDDEVLVGFEHGDVRFPYIIGALHNGVDKPPQCNDISSKIGGVKGYNHTKHETSGRDWNEDGKNDLRFIRSRSGHLFIFDDKQGNEKITVVDTSNNLSIEVCTKEKKISITSASGDIELVAKETVLIRCKNLITETWENTEMTADGEVIVHSKKDMTHKSDANMTRKAAQNVNENAGAARTVKSSGNTTIKGANVFIN